MDMEIWGVRERCHKLSPRDCHHCMKEFKRFVRWAQICLSGCRSPLLNWSLQNFFLRDQSFKANEAGTAFPKFYVNRSSVRDWCYNLHQWLRAVSLPETATPSGQSNTFFPDCWSWNTHKKKSISGKKDKY